MEKEAPDALEMAEKKIKKREEKKKAAQSEKQVVLN